MAKVYVTQEQDKRDITGALQYGEIEILLPNGHQIMFSPAPTIKRLERKLSTFSDNDYILLMGDPAIIGATCMVASQINNGKIKLLKWINSQQKYIPIQLDLHDRSDT
jgi:hypothetical protein